MRGIYKKLSGALGILLFPVVIFAGGFGGTVTDADTGEPVSGAVVSLVGTETVASTAGDGTYSVPNLPPGAYTAVFSAEGYMPYNAYVSVTGYSEVTCDVSLYEGSQTAGWGQTSYPGGALIVHGQTGQLEDVEEGDEAGDVEVVPFESSSILYVTGDPVGYDMALMQRGYVEILAPADQQVTDEYLDRWPVQDSETTTYILVPRAPGYYW